MLVRHMHVTHIAKTVLNIHIFWAVIKGGTANQVYIAFRPLRHYFVFVRRGRLFILFENHTLSYLKGANYS